MDTDRPSEAGMVFTFESGDLRQGLGIGGRVEEGSRQAGGEEGPPGSHCAVDADSRNKTRTLTFTFRRLADPFYPKRPTCEWSRTIKA